MESLIMFRYNALAGVAGNIIYKLLNDSLEKEDVNKLIDLVMLDIFEESKKYY